MTWNLTMLFVHGAMLIALLTLWRGTPGFVQHLVLGLLIAAAGLFVVYWGAQSAGYAMPWQFKLVAYQAEHIAVLLYVLRIFIADQERRCLPTSSVPSPSSQR